VPIKDLLVLADRAAPSRQRLEFALAVAQRLSADVTALALVPEPYLPTLEGVHIPLELVRQQLEEAEREADTILAAAQEAAGKRAVPLATGRITAPKEQMATLFARMARQTDLCVVGQLTESAAWSPCSSGSTAPAIRLRRVEGAIHDETRHCHTSDRYRW
jgi:nucleotide-binding universal stress UspA family protein